ncbi:FAD-dependent oxidoreductase [Micromonospora matsumotoense]|uniref:FAD-dependent oxidoreductase n=1 Tax=Micromonospora matsumotoense TaxID=121616 RepID=UPI003D93CFA9
MTELRVLVVGAGLAGVLLARRLQDAGAEAVLIGTATDGPTGGYRDATAASGGLVRAFEPEPAARALAAASLAELRGDPGLAAEAGWRRTGSLYLLDPDTVAGGGSGPGPGPPRSMPRCSPLRRPPAASASTGCPSTPWGSGSGGPATWCRTGCGGPCWPG